MPKNQQFNPKDIPHDVWWVWTIQYANQPVGSDTYNKIQEIIDKHPQYFEWEHKYKKIPQDVHDAFLKECYHQIFEPINKSEKLITKITKLEPTKPTIKEWIDTLKKFKNQIHTKKIKQNETAKHICNKHYKKYKLKYRDIY